MTSKRYKLILIVIVIGMFLFFRNKNGSVSPVPKASLKESKQVQSKSTPTVSHISGPASPTRRPSSIAYKQAPKVEWQERLEKNLKVQGGNALKSVSIKTEKTFTWERENAPIHAAIVVVSLLNQQDEESSFRAVVDSKTGKILETFDRTIQDPANPRKGFRLRLDPRYSH